MESFAKLSGELMVSVFSYCSIYHALSFATVNKSWRSFAAVSLPPTPLPPPTTSQLTNATKDNQLWQEFAYRDFPDLLAHLEETSRKKLNKVKRWKRLYFKLSTHLLPFSFASPPRHKQETAALITFFAKENRTLTFKEISTQ